ncbi:hypothetical protein [Conexibacter sp. SYSU D00693]|uniref:hypothetical protein n=1 Tax=Conexibacter sp. SYSU D00693 TaxID=2812560 RepID=UPI00196AEF7C|nr:hypothetical protein [Conexibacter sp. SYSU D00693]
MDGAVDPGHALARTWFAPRHPNRCWAEAVVSDRLPGRVWTLPRAGDPMTVVVEAGERFCFVGGRVDDDVLAHLTDALRERSPAAQVVLPPSWHDVPFTVPAGRRTQGRAHFRAPAHRLREALTQELEDDRRAHLARQDVCVRRLEADDFDDPLLHDTMRAIYGDAEHFGAEPEMGFCAVDTDGLLVSWLHPICGDTTAEVGAGTRADARGRGISAALNVLTVRALALQGFDVTASWVLEHPASPGLAGHVALEHEFDYTVLVPVEG